MLVREEIIEDIKIHLMSEIDFYKAMDRKFREKYKVGLNELEERIEREGTPLEEHDMWEDSIEWRNALEEIEKAERILREISY
ncbi:MAG: hypothetical protein ACE5GD_02825 [Candidatus Geothermarchaeales archaeon]